MANIYPKNQFFFYLVSLKSLKPNYYEPIEEFEATQSNNIYNCYQNCVNNSTCIQYVFFNNKKKCYLKRRFYIENGVSNGDADVRSMQLN